MSKIWQGHATPSGGGSFEDLPHLFPSSWCSLKALRGSLENQRFSPRPSPESKQRWRPDNLDLTSVHGPGDPFCHSHGHCNRLRPHDADQGRLTDARPIMTSDPKTNHDNYACLRSRTSVWSSLTHPPTSRRVPLEVSSC